MPPDGNVFRRFLRGPAGIPERALEGLAFVVWEGNLPSGDLRWVSPNAEAVFGWPASAWLQPGFWDRLAGEHGDRVLDRWASLDAAPDGAVAEFEIDFADANGRVRHVDCFARVVAADGDRILRGFLVDATTRRIAADRKTESARALRESFDSIPEAILVHDLDGLIVEANRHACALLGYDADELVGASIALVQPGLDAPSVRARWKSLEPGATLTITGEYRRRDGSLFPVEIRVGAVVPPHRIVVLARDTSDRREFEQQLRQTQKMEAVGRLAGGVAHDFNNLLTAIKGHAELLIQDARDDRAARDLAEISRAADRATVLTRKLLAFSRQQVFAPEILDLNAILRDTERLLRPLIGEHIEFRTETGAIGRIRADHGQVEQVLVNLIVNARDAMTGGGSLLVRTLNLDVDDARPYPYPFVRNGQYVVLDVVDSGTGIDAETLKRIFEPFFTTKDESSGSGLGLAIAYGIVKQSGGYLIAESQPGRGATFHVIFPRSDPVVEPHPREMKELAEAGGRVALLAEDEEPVRSFVARVLRREGFHVIETASAEEAIQRAAEFDGALDLVITDLEMPGRDGLDLARSLAQTRPATPIILMSGYDAAAPRLAGVASGVSVLLKPFTPADLADRIAAILTR